MSDHAKMLLLILGLFGGLILLSPIWTLVARWGERIGLAIEHRYKRLRGKVAGIAAHAAFAMCFLSYMAVLFYLVTYF